MASGFVDEVQHRRAVRIVVGYAVGVFAVLQIVEPVMHGLHWPDALLSYLVVALAAGFPLVVGVAWLIEVRRRQKEAGAGGAVAGARPRADWRRTAAIAAGVALLVSAPLVAWVLPLWPGAHVLPAAADKLRAAIDPAGSAEPLAAGPSIAVLPLLNLSRDPEQEYFADGLAEELLDLLAKIPGLRVAARTSAFAFKGKSADLRVVGQQLNVTHVLEGSVRRSGDRLRVSTQLVKVSDGYHLWSETYDRKVTEVFALQDEIASAVVFALALKLIREPEPSDRHTALPEAWNQYLLGRRYFFLGNLDDFRRAASSFRAAVELDPSYAAAWAGLSSATYSVAEEAESAQAVAAGFEEARAAAEKAVLLGPGLPEGYRARGYLRAQVDWDWAGAAADLQRALLLEPESPDALAFYAGLVLRPTGRLTEAATLLRKATALDPLNPRLWSSLGSTLLSLGQTGPAREALERSLRLSPAQSFTDFNVAVSLLLEHRPADALVITQGSTTEIFRLLGAALAHHDLGHTAEWRRLAERMTRKFAHSDAYQIAEAWAWCGEPDLAFTWLERARAQHDGGLAMLKVDPLFQGLHGDPRWSTQLAGINLPPE